MKGFYLLLIILIFLGGCSGENELRKPNILFITTDCQAWEDVPRITPVLEMPALEKLLSESVVFKNHYSVAPVSMPSRYTIISGRYPHYHKLMDDGGNWLPDNTPVLMKKLSEEGYKTAGIGKMHFKPWERKAGFDFRIIADCQGNSSSDTLKQDDYYFYLKKAGLTRWDYLKYFNSTDIYGLYDWPLDDTLDIDYFVGSQTVKILESDSLSSNSPWFLWISFNGPHYPWDASKKITEKYMSYDLPEARYRTDELDDKPFDVTYTRYTYSRNIADLIDKCPEKEREIIKRIRAAHYGNLTQIDNQLERIIKSLKNRKDFNNTIVVFTSSYGALLGDHQNFQGGASYERASHVPFLIWWPSQFKYKEINGFTSHVDIFPTFIDFAGGTMPEILDGKSLMPVIEGDNNADKQAYIEILDNYSIVSNKYKFGLFTPYNEGELYDRRMDPDELFNVFDQEKYKEVVDSLTNLLYVFYPELKNILASRQEYFPLPDAVELKHGEILHGNKVPYFPERTLKMLVDCKLKKNATGPLIICDIENLHGFSLFTESGQLFFGIRKWEKEIIYKIPEKLSDKRMKINIEIDTEGILSVSSNNLSRTYKFQTIWPLPNQQGHPEYQMKTICSGISGDGWIKPFGKLNRSTALEGTVYSCLISVGNKK